ncbi:MAG: hypothetical protein ACE5NC_05915 [Anaerolineae bacterium]
MNVRWSRAVVAGLVAFAAVFPVAVFLFGNPLSRRIVFTTDFGQSSKLLANWLETQPIPPVGPFWEDLLAFTPEKVGILLALAGVLVVHALIYQIVAPVLPSAGWRKGISFGIGVWALVYLFYEIFVPLNQFGEPIPIVVYELILWFVVAAVEGLVIAAVTGWQGATPTASG